LYQFLVLVVAATDNALKIKWRSFILLQGTNCYG